jgi:hypothetical protein
MQLQRPRIVALVGLLLAAGLGMVISNVSPVSAQAALTVTPLSVAPGQSVSISWVGLSPSGNDWISLHPAGAPDSNYLDWKKITSASGSLSFAGPANPGSYQFRLFRNGARVSTSNAFQVQSPQLVPPPQPTPQPPAARPQPNGTVALTCAILTLTGNTGLTPGSLVLDATWSSYPGATDYWLQISTSSQRYSIPGPNNGSFVSVTGSPNWNAPVGNVTSKYLTGAVQGTTYYAVVGPTNQQGGAYPQLASVTCPVYPTQTTTPHPQPSQPQPQPPAAQRPQQPLPPPPTMHEPICAPDGRSITWWWSAVPGATNYFLQVSTQAAQNPDGSFVDANTYNRWIDSTNTSQVLSGLQPGVTYFAVVNWTGPAKMADGPTSNRVSANCQSTHSRRVVGRSGHILEVQVNVDVPDAARVGIRNSMNAPLEITQIRVRNVSNIHADDSIYAAVRYLPPSGIDAAFSQTWAKIAASFDAPDSVLEIRAEITWYSLWVRILEQLAAGPEQFQRIEEARRVAEEMPLLQEALKSLITDNVAIGLPLYSYHLGRSLFQEAAQWSEVAQILSGQAVDIAEALFLDLPSNIVSLGEIVEVYTYFGGGDTVTFSVELR